MKELVLDIKELTVAFQMYDKGTKQMELPVISKLNLEIAKGEMIAVVGSSGSGKSLLAHAIMGLLPSNAKIAGEICYKGQPLNEENRKKLRGKEMALVPQSVSYLDPLMKMERQVLGKKQGITAEKRKRMWDCFKRLELPNRTCKLYPFQLSGGMARRVLVSTAVLEDAGLIIADEPTPGMHGKAAREAVHIFREMADQGRGVLLITHDLDLAVQTADKVAVFYGGSILEIAKASDFQGAGEKLRHPYSKALWNALPQNGFHTIEGKQPYAGSIKEGCLFRDRCSQCTSACEKDIPMADIREGKVRCIYAT